MERDAYREAHSCLTDALNATERAFALLVSGGSVVARGPGGREISLAVTRNQESRHWLLDAIEALERDWQGPQ